MGTQIWPWRTLLSAGLLLLSNPLAQASPPHPELFQCGLGGPNIAGTQQNFGGTSTAEYGPIQAVFYPAANGQPNPCPAFFDE